MKYAALQKLLHKAYSPDKPEEEKLEAYLRSDVELFHLKMLSEELRERGLSGEFKLILSIDDFNKLVPLGHKSWAEGDYATIVPASPAKSSRDLDNILLQEPPTPLMGNRKLRDSSDNPSQGAACWDCYAGLCKDH